MIKFCDGEGAKIGEVYERMDSTVGEIKDVMKMCTSHTSPKFKILFKLGGRK